MAGKRKSDASSSAPTKKARKQVSVDASDLVASILDEDENLQLPEGDKTILEHMLRYARSLEEAAEDLKPKTKSPQEIQAAAGKLRAVAVSGIQKRPPCKTGSSKWAYDVVCADPAVFTAMLGLDLPIKFKMKKIPIADFENSMGDIQGHARYNTLYLKGDHVNVHCKAEEGTFKFSGSYGA
ncbi:hypothetical protein BDN71DRAFT_1503513 [Pleurotus eryngii]|uniref:Uncharacterized protein n=1 Tax=Pleurotus eryngii TaxID=5323 RepID=A0A9P6DBN0_PLEER|nr:hypothetical protein BDN71DRAFT_1503513 [Pleurotus eryngii]